MLYCRELLSLDFSDLSPSATSAATEYPRRAWFRAGDDSCPDSKGSMEHFGGTSDPFAPCLVPT